MNPTISVCIPVYNSERFIGDTIESVLKQTYTDFELIIIDNNSIDKTTDVIKKYNDSRIRLLINKSNIGPQRNFNRCLKEASGAYVKLLCADDLLYPSCLQKQLEPFDNPEYDNLVMVCCARDIVTEAGKRIMRRGFLFSDGILPGRKAVKKMVRTGTNLIGEPNGVLFKADVVKKIGYFDESASYIIDMDYWCRTLTLGDIFIIPESLCAFRVFSNSWSVDLGLSQSRQVIELINKLKRDKEYNLNPFECFFGKILAFSNGILRNLFYKFFIKD